MSSNTELAAQQAAGFRKLAAFIEQNPEVAPFAAYLDDGINVFHVWGKDDAQMIIRAALASGAKVDKRYFNDTFSADFTFGAVKVSLLGNRAAVCEKVVTTREVIEEVPDPQALAAVPTVTVTKTVEDVEWVCRPLLAADTETAVA
jgi:hypothetical protein